MEAVAFSQKWGRGTTGHDLADGNKEYFFDPFQKIDVRNAEAKIQTVATNLLQFAMSFPVSPSIVC
jgi:hypothetical protein